MLSGTSCGEAFARCSITIIVDQTYVVEKYLIIWLAVFSTLRLISYFNLELLLLCSVPCEVKNSIFSAVNCLTLVTYVLQTLLLF